MCLLVAPYSQYIVFNAAAGSIRLTHQSAGVSLCSKPFNSLRIKAKSLARSRVSSGLSDLILYYHPLHLLSWGHSGPRQLHSHLGMLPPHNPCTYFSQESPSSRLSMPMAYSHVLQVSAQIILLREAPLVHPNIFCSRASICPTLSSFRFCFSPQHLLTQHIAYCVY